MFALVAVLLALGSASAGRGLLQRRLPPLPIDPRTEALAATITTAGTLAAARPLFSPVDIIMARTCSLPELCDEHSPAAVQPRGHHHGAHLLPTCAEHV